MRQAVFIHIEDTLHFILYQMPFFQFDILFCIDIFNHDIIYKDKIFYNMVLKRDLELNK
jgi:hypothetical protein